jgi:hypothetical protein
MDGRLSGVLTGARPAGMYRWRSRAHPNSVHREAAAAGWAVYPLDGRVVTGTEALFDRCADMLSFPARFAHSWDAFADCVADLSWLPGNGHVVLWDKYGALARQDPKAWQMAYQTLSSATIHRSAKDAPLYVLLRGTGPLERPDDAGPIPVL